jgi:hypothetical protein
MSERGSRATAETRPFHDDRARRGDRYARTRSTRPYRTSTLSPSRSRPSRAERPICGPTFGRAHRAPRLGEHLIQEAGKVLELGLLLERLEDVCADAGCAAGPYRGAHVSGDRSGEAHGDLGDGHAGHHTGCAEAGVHPRARAATPLVRAPSRTRRSCRARRRSDWASRTPIRAVSDADSSVRGT